MAGRLIRVQTPDDATPVQISSGHAFPFFGGRFPVVVEFTKRSMPQPRRLVSLSKLPAGNQTPGSGDFSLTGFMASFKFVWAVSPSEENKKCNTNKNATTPVSLHRGYWPPIPCEKRGKCPVRRTRCKFLASSRSWLCWLNHGL